MTTGTSAVEGHEVRCWCCGKAYDEARVVHLGEHPEVAVCIDCARDLNRRARKREAAAVARWLHQRGDAARGAVMERGWHERPVVGRALRWINRHSPW
jgi:ribosome-binding protein aMBF1 (putative translation factor)